MAGLLGNTLTRSHGECDLARCSQKLLELHRWCCQGSINQIPGPLGYLAT
jgi:hypothetical protein